MTQNEIDRQSILKAKQFFASGQIANVEVGTLRGLPGIEQSYYYEGYEPE